MIPIIVLLGCALLIGALSLPMIRGWVPPNGLYGFRTPATLASEALWYPANRYAGWQMLYAAIAQLLGVLALFLLADGLPEPVILLAGLVLLTVTLLVAVVRSFRYLNRLQEDRDRT
ncbi:SdpI family protein [Gammaproteobacteria bacterium AB-CW1]|uniref:SdpI family protein n=1 Tax=Natronospira elongata TaxID=3110268 RepID=A0AAP6JFJ8_9GAMM|nr:SdpI family protein [Gammaproteobacteria bacterium AB-CW1]